MSSELIFQPPQVLDSNAGDAAKNYPISLQLYSAASDKTALYRLRYRAFREAGWINDDPRQEFEDRYDALPSTFAVGAFHDGACIGSLRLAFGGAGYPAHTMPCEEQFPREIERINPGRRRRLVEVSRMAVEPSLDNRSFRTTLYASLVRAGVIMATASSFDLMLIAVHRRISAFYQAMCGFKVIGKSESYAGIAEPTNFLALDASAMDARRRRSNAFFGFSQAEIESARQAMLNLRASKAA